MKNIPIYRVVLSDDADGITKMSFVKFPAVDINWIALSKEDENKTLMLFDDDKHIVTSVALRANYPIYRRDSKGEYYTIFTRENIEKIVQRFFRDNKINSVNLEHSLNVYGCYLIESYFAKADNEFGVAEGSWICSYKVDNPQVWSDIKNKKINGFSIEGFFTFEEYDELEEEINKILN